MYQADSFIIFIQLLEWYISRFSRWKIERHFYNEIYRQVTGGGIINLKWSFSKMIILKAWYWWEVFLPWNSYSLFHHFISWLWMFLLSYCEDLQRKSIQLLFVEMENGELFWRSSQGFRAAIERVRLSIAPHYTLWAEAKFLLRSLAPSGLLLF